MDENQVLELVEFYEDMIEKQDEIIVRQSRFIKSLATELSHLRNMLNVEASEDERLDAGIIEEVRVCKHEGTVEVPFFHGGKVWCMREIDLLGATHWHLLMAKGGSYAKTGGLVNRR